MNRFLTFEYFKIALHTIVQFNYVSFGSVENHVDFMPLVPVARMQPRFLLVSNCLTELFSGCANKVIAERCGRVMLEGGSQVLPGVGIVTAYVLLGEVFQGSRTCIAGIQLHLR